MTKEEILIKNNYKRIEVFESLKLFKKFKDFIHKSYQDEYKDDVVNVVRIYLKSLSYEGLFSIAVINPQTNTILDFFMKDFKGIEVRDSDEIETIINDFNEHIQVVIETDENEEECILA